MWGQFEFILPSLTLVWSTSLGLHGRCGGRKHQHSTSGRRRRRRLTFHMLTHGAMWGWGLTSLMVCINDKVSDIRERNVTIRSEILTMHVRSLGFRVIRECVTLWRLILWSLGCMCNEVVFTNKFSLYPCTPPWAKTNRKLLFRTSALVGHSRSRS
jgi:hypothetical protein